MQSLLLCFLTIVSAVHGSIVSQSDLDTIYFRLYTGSSLESHIDRGLENASDLLRYMDLDAPTVVYLHGFTESAKSKSVCTVAEAYIHRKDHNVLVVDYRKIANQTYVMAAASVNAVGSALADAVEDMVKNGLNKETLHIVGHSLGAQVAGYFARQVHFLVRRITGLDPAGPLFTLVGQELSKTDAKFVDIIHTDRKFYGNGWPSGHVNFYPNGGHRIQPGCPLHPWIFSKEDFCSHHRSWQFYAESLWKEDAFYAVECALETLFKRGHCDGNKITLMGIATPSDVEGSYFLRTAAESPFGLGIAGAKSGKK